MSGFQMQRLGQIMEPQPGNPLEAEGVLNPAAIRGPDGGLYLFPRLVARGNYSRIGIARVQFNEAGDPTGVERLGIGLEPEADYERRSDGSVFPVAIPDPSGQPSLALVHRPLFPGTRPEEKVRDPESDVMDIHRESIWISYREMAVKDGDPCHLCHFSSHHRLAAPVAPWEQLKIGGGTPPILTRHGWLIIYHGVSEMAAPGNHQLCYSAGVMLLSEENPRLIRYRSSEPVLTPELPRERQGIVRNVVFPTGIDRRDDLGTPNRFDVYYGMADNWIGVARLDVPEQLPVMCRQTDPSRSVCNL